MQKLDKIKISIPFLLFIGILSTFFSDEAIIEDVYFAQIKNIYRLRCFFDKTSSRSLFYPIRYLRENECVLPVVVFDFVDREIFRRIPTAMSRDKSDDPP